MRSVRRSAAWLLLAVFAIGGAAGPAVHGIAHGLERAALQAAHATDGHHTAGERGAHVHAACTLRLADDGACALCHGPSAGIAALAAGVPDADPVAREQAATETHEPGRRVAPAASRGPPAEAA